MHRQAPALVIMAAGMGSRFGGLKQMDAGGHGGPQHHRLFACTTHTARASASWYSSSSASMTPCSASGSAAVWSRFFHVSYVYQELTDIPDGCEVPEGRVKPWGTGQAVACCRNVLRRAVRRHQLRRFLWPHGLSGDL